MLYVAQRFIGFGPAGVVTPGEVLTSEQEEALGADRIKEMLEKRALSTVGESASPSCDPAPEADPLKDQADSAEEDADELDGEAGETDTPGDAEEAENLPVLDSIGDIVTADGTPAEPECQEDDIANKATTEKKATRRSNNAKKGGKEKDNEGNRS